MANTSAWVDQTRDRRGGRVVFLAHCLLNENTRVRRSACTTVVTALCCVLSSGYHSDDHRMTAPTPEDSPARDPRLGPGCSNGEGETR